MNMTAIRIIGIDPGLRNTGWGVIESEGTRLVFLACGTVRSDIKASLAERLRQLHQGLETVLHEHRPDEAAVEETFVNKDARATLKLGHARGIALLVPAQAGLSVAEYAPNLVKKTIVGTGHAEKEQIHMMVKILLPRSSAQSPDASDALAVALTHAQHRVSRALERAVLARAR
jgi:crossover junction endodeoxyribonuclease RuvC